MSINHNVFRIWIYIFVFLCVISIACAGISNSAETASLALTQTSLAQTSVALAATAVQPVITEQIVVVTPEVAVVTQAPVQVQQTEPPPPPPLTTQGPVAPVISANINTNCREGPTVDYKVLGYLLKNQTSEVYGRDSSKNWWYITNPDKPDQYCWVWTETTTVKGDTANLPVITPPAPAVLADLSFTASFSGLNTCDGKSMAIFQIKNGEVPLESLLSSLEITGGGPTIYGPSQFDTPFMGSSSECPPGGDSAVKNSTTYIMGGVLPDVMIVGTEVRATIELCSQNDLNGECLTKVIDFTP